MKLSAAQFEAMAIEQMDMLHRIARRLTRNAQQAEDLVQETYLRAFRAREGFELQEYGIRPWLLRILHNLNVNRAERDTRQPQSIDDSFLQSAPAASVPGGSAFANQPLEQMDERLKRAVEELPSEYSSVLLLWAVDDFSYKEIAQSLDIPLGTVMSRLHRARQRLASELHGLAVEQRIIRE